MADRDDANLRQFKSRAQQPKNLRAGPSAPGGGVGQSIAPHAPVNVYVVYDSDFGGVTDRYDATRFKYTGTSPKVTTYEYMHGRRVQHESVGSTFHW